MPIPQQVVVIGAGGHGREVHTYIEDIARNGWNGQMLGFLDDGVPAGPFRNSKILGRMDGLRDSPAERFENLFYITAMGDNGVRRRVVEALISHYGERLRPWTLVHPRAYIGSNVELGQDVCVAPDAILTCRVKVGSHCIVNVKASISHDCEIGAFSNINPGATICGNVSIGEGCFIGAGATIIDKKTVGEGCIIGAGAVVVRDIPAHCTAVGVPARVIRRHR